MSGLGRTLADLELRNAATMRAAQAAYDNLAPDDDEPDEDFLTEDIATEIAREEILATPAACADALAKLADPEWSPDSKPRERPGWSVHDVPALTADARAAETMQTHELVAVLMLGDDRAAMDALRELRERIAAALADDIARLAHEKLVEQDRMLAKMRDEWLIEQMERAA